ncbi:MAG: EAL domain-containing protein [Xanthomonadales bacterium]|nr:EAL domain-containing protein [Xanthomonadales bacterium]
MLFAKSSIEVKRALDADPPVLILYAKPEEADAPLTEVAELAAAFGVPVALYSGMDQPEKLASLLSETACFVINAEREDLLTDAVMRLITTSENERQQASQRQTLDELEHRYNLLLESARDAIAYVHEGLHVYANRAYLETLKITDDSELAGISLLEILKSEGTDLKKLLKGFGKGSFPSEPLEVQVTRPDGSEFVARLLFSPARFDGEDCTQMMLQRKDAANELAAELERMRSTDHLTQFHNRQAFADALESTMEEQSPDYVAAVLYIEPDGYEDLQDELDVASMDLLVSDLAALTRLNLDNDDLPARLNERGFAILARRPDSASLEALADKLLTAWRGHIIEIGDRAFSISCSIGLGKLGRLATNAPEVIAQARKAQAEAAENGDRFVVYRPQLTAVASIEGEQDWIERIKFALANQDFYSVQQTIVDLDGEGDQMVENTTFLRGEDNDHGPSEFLDAAERNDLAGNIDRYIIPGLLKTFADSSERQIINLSSNSILDYNFPGWFASQMEAACVDSGKVILQIHARDAQTNLRPAQRLMNELKPLGCRLSVCGFDEERRTLQLLDHLDVSFVKLKHEITRDLTASSRNQEIIREIVEAAEPNEVEVIADEVEDTSSLAVLWQCGVKLIAGSFLKESSQVLAQ